MGILLDAVHRRNVARRAWDESEGGEAEARELDAAADELLALDRSHHELREALREIAFMGLDLPAGGGFDPARWYRDRALRAIGIAQDAIAKTTDDDVLE